MNQENSENRTPDMNQSSEDTDLDLEVQRAGRLGSLEALEEDEKLGLLDEEDRKNLEELRELVKQDQEQIKNQEPNQQ